MKLHIGSVPYVITSVCKQTEQLVQQPGGYSVPVKNGIC